MVKSFPFMKISDYSTPASMARDWEGKLHFKILLVRHFHILNKMHDISLDLVKGGTFMSYSKAHSYHTTLGPRNDCNQNIISYSKH